MKKKIRVGILQIGDSFGGQFYFPYSVMLLQSYAQKYLENAQSYEFMVPIYSKMSVFDTVNYLEKAHIIFFSVYIWNFRISLEIARCVKKNDPKKIIVFGGPQIPQQNGALGLFLRNHPYVDIGCFDEGEIPFLKILESYPHCKNEDIPSIGYIKDTGEVVRNFAGERISNLDEIPSPYLEGALENLMERNPKISWSAIWETNRGCPFSCTFCAWGTKEKNKVYLFNIERLFREIDWFSEKKIEFIFCADANFGIFERDYEIVKKVAHNKAKFGYPKVFSVQNTKNSTVKIVKIQKILNDAGLQKGVNLALQTVNRKSLNSIKRSNIKSEVYQNLQHILTKEKIPTFTDIILGLPQETYNTLTNGISSLIESGQHNRMQFINLAMLENTEMSDPAYIEKYGLILKETKVVSHHTSIDNNEGISEMQTLVLGTNCMPKKDWVNSRIFCWMTSLLYFNKLLQIPFILLNQVCSISYKELVELFLIKLDKYPCISEICSFFRQKAMDIQKGGAEYVPSKEWLGIWWPADEHIFIKLCVEEQLSLFYEEAKSVIYQYLKEKKVKLSNNVLDDSIRLNKNLIKQPFATEDVQLFLDYNVLEVYQGALNGWHIPLEYGVFSYIIDRTSNTWVSWPAWCKEVVWYGTKKGAYLYDCRRMNISSKENNILKAVKT